MILREEVLSRNAGDGENMSILWEYMSILNHHLLFMGRKVLHLDRRKQ